MGSDDENVISTAAASAPGGGEKLTKSQKKRKKKKASKNKAAAADERQKPASTTPAALNPHVKLRQDLVAKGGYTIEEVEVALEEMWNLGMSYDEFDAALAYMKSKKAGGEAVAAQEIPMKTETETTVNADVGAAAAEAPVAAAAATPSTAVAEAKEEEPVAAAVAPAPAAKPEPPMDLASKLELVADFENLGDGIYALTEWVVKVATQAEIMDLCQAVKTRALSTILRRALTEGTDKTFNMVVLPTLLGLIGGILSKAGIASSGAIQTSMASLLTTARSGDVLETNKVVDFCISNLYKAVEMASFVTTSENQGMQAITEIENEIDALATSLANGGNAGGVVELMTKRDAHKSAAEKSSTVVGITMVSSQSTGDEESSGDKELPKGKLSSEEGKTEMLVALLGEDMYESILQSRAEQAELERQLTEAQSDSSAELQLVNAEMIHCQTQKDTIAARIAELTREIDYLRVQETEWADKLGVAESKMAELDASCSGEIQQLKNTLAEKRKVLSTDTVARGLVSEMEVYESSLLQAVAATAASASKAAAVSAARAPSADNLSEKISNKMGIYLVRVRNYFQAEADVVEFLSARAQTLEYGIHDLELEIQECKALGMATNVAQMEKSLATTRQNIADDLAVVEALRGEAETMRRDLTNRLNEYNASSGTKWESNCAFTSLHVSVLKGIESAIARIGLNSNGQNLSAYIASLSANDTGVLGMATDPVVPVEQQQLHQQPQPPMNGTDVGYGEPEEKMKDSDEGVVNNNNMHEDHNVATGHSNGHTAPTAMAAVMPKMSWASTASSSVGKQKGEPKSFLDIQKEELSAKNE